MSQVFRPYSNVIARVSSVGAVFLSEVFNMSWQPPADEPNLGAELMAAHDVHGRQDCTACHR